MKTESNEFVFSVTEISFLTQSENLATSVNKMKSFVPQSWMTAADTSPAIWMVFPFFTKYPDPESPEILI